MLRDRPGFTLVEVLVALVIGAMVLAGARGLMEGLADHAAATVRVARVGDSIANSERTVRQVVGNIALAPRLEPSFIGTPTQAGFASWCPSVFGGLEACSAHLLVVRSDTAAEVVLALSTGMRLSIGHGTTVRLRYLADAGAGGRWHARWDDVLTPPLAIGVLAGTDTMLFRIGERR